MKRKARRSRIVDCMSAFEASVVRSFEAVPLSQLLAEELWSRLKILFI